MVWPFVLILVGSTKGLGSIYLKGVIMPKLTLEDGTVVEISQTSYDNLKEATKKDWRDAFIEKIGVGIEKVECSMADAIKVNSCEDCTRLRSLMKYVLKFENGGFWLDGHGLHFVTRGYGCAEKATYQHAKEFLQNL